MYFRFNPVKKSAFYQRKSDLNSLVDHMYCKTQNQRRLNCTDGHFVESRIQWVRNMGLGYSGCLR